MNFTRTIALAAGLASLLTAAVGAAARTGSIVERAVPTANSQPVSIVAGPDGNLWFTEFRGNKIGRLDVKTVGKPIAPGVRAASPSMTLHSRGSSRRRSDAIARRLSD